MSEGKSTSVVLIDQDPVMRNSIKNFLTQLGCKIVGEAENLGSGLNLVKGMHPDILILELPKHSEQALNAVRTLKTELPDMGIIMTAGDTSPDLIIRSMRAGAQEFLTRPLNGNELAAAVKRLAEARATTAKKGAPGSIITVFSSKGGVGVTSIATNLAASYAVNAGKRTVIVDLNMQMAEVGLLLDLHPQYTIADAIGVGNLDESRLKGLLTVHESGVHLLSSPEDPVEAEMITPSLLLEVFSLLKSMFDVIVVDAGHFFDSRVLEVLNMADKILVVASLDVPTVRNVRRCLMLFRQLGYTQEKVLLMVNREQKKSKVTAEDLEAAAETAVFWQTPGDYKSLIESIDVGVPVVIQNPKAKISRSIEDMTYELCRMQGDVEPEAGSFTPKDFQRMAG